MFRRRTSRLYITLLVTARPFAGRGVGGTLLAHARDEAQRLGVGLVRVDCYSGGDGRLVDYYRRNGFTPVATFTVGTWPGQLLSQRTWPENEYLSHAVGALPMASKALCRCQGHDGAVGLGEGERPVGREAPGCPGVRGQQCLLDDRFQGASDRGRPAFFVVTVLVRLRVGTHALT
jgi:hypothetical protein